MNIVDLPIEARIRENSSLLIDYDSSSEINNMRTRSRIERQGSGIEELSKLLAADKLPQEEGEKEGVEAVEKGEEVIETSLNMRMSRRQRNDEAKSPVVIMGRAIDSAWSL